MILHLGGDYIVPIKNIIFIINYKKCADNKDNLSFFEKLEAKKTVIGEGETKSVIYSDFMGEKQLFYSPISCATLLKRASNRT